MSKNELIDVIQKILECADLRELDLAYRMLKTMVSK